jgi:hypothetical protein
MGIGKKGKQKREPMVQCTIRLPKKEINRMEKIVDEDQLHYPTVSQLIRIFISDGLKKVEKEVSRN